MIALDVARHMRSYLRQTGPGYVAQPIGSAFEVDRVAGYYVDLSEKTCEERALYPERLNPVTLAQIALGEYECHLAGHRGTERFLELAHLLGERGEEHADGVRWSYDLTVAKYGLDGPWYSAMAQGEAASVFVRAHHVEGGTTFSRLAEAAVAPLLARSPDLVVETGCGPALEEAPSNPASLVLNGWIFALWGLKDVALGLGDPAANALFEESACALERMLPRYDTGRWSLYSVFPHPLADLAKPFYHRLHCDQLEVMGALTGSASFSDASRRFRGYEHSSLRRAVVASNKLAFAAIDGAVRQPRLIAGSRRPAPPDDRPGL